MAVSASAWCRVATQTYLAEVHRLDTLGTQSRTDGRRGRCLAGADNELDDLVVCERLACHGGCSGVYLAAHMRRLQTKSYQCRNFLTRTCGQPEVPWNHVMIAPTPAEGGPADVGRQSLGVGTCGDNWRDPCLYRTHHNLHSFALQASGDAAAANHGSLADPVVSVCPAVPSVGCGLRLFCTSCMTCGTRTRASTSSSPTTGPPLSTGRIFVQPRSPFAFHGCCCCETRRRPLIVGATSTCP